MNERQSHVVVLIGSPRGVEKSSSAKLARVIASGLESAKWSCEWFHTHRVLQSQKDWDAMVASMSRADVILLAAPLYVDGLPAPVIETLHRLLEAKSVLVSGGNPPRMLALLNCGFIEAEQNYTAQMMVRVFSDNMGFQWAGGISLGAGGTMTKRIRAALEMVSTALRDDILIPDAVEVLTCKPIMKPWLYALGGSFMWRRWAKANGVRDQLKAQPYKRA